MDPITTGPGCFAKNTRPHFVYELWTDTSCLYVGLSANVGGRLNAHRSKPWWGKVRRVECDWFPDKSQAMIREAELIERHDPLYNWQHSERAAGSRSGRGAGGVAFRKTDVIA